MDAKVGVDQSSPAVRFGLLIVRQGRKEMCEQGKRADRGLYTYMQSDETAVEHWDGGTGRGRGIVRVQRNTARLPPRYRHYIHLASSLASEDGAGHANAEDPVPRSSVAQPLTIDA